MDFSRGIDSMNISMISSIQQMSEVVVRGEADHSLFLWLLVCIFFSIEVSNSLSRSIFSKEKFQYLYLHEFCNFLQQVENNDRLWEIVFFTDVYHRLGIFSI